MLHAVIRGSRDTIHFIGHVEPYNIETLEQHATGRRTGDGPVNLHIWVTPDDEQALQRAAGRMFDRLERDGVRVTVVAGPSTRVPLH